MSKWKKPENENLEVFKKRLNLNDFDILKYQALYEAATSKIEKYRKDKRFILPPNFLPHNTINIETVGQFRARLNLYSSVFTTHFIKNQNEWANEKMERFIKRMGLDDKAENDLINEWRSLKWWQKRDLFARNEELPEFIYASEEEIENSVFDFTENKIRGMINYAKKAKNMSTAKKVKPNA